MNAEAQEVVFVLVWPVLCGMAIRVYVWACERADSRMASRAHAHLGGRQC
jgi:hypothetical protein